MTINVFDFNDLKPVFYFSCRMCVKNENCDASSCAVLHVLNRTMEKQIVGSNNCFSSTCFYLNRSKIIKTSYFRDNMRQFRKVNSR